MTVKEIHKPPATGSLIVNGRYSRRASRVIKITLILRALFQFLGPNAAWNGRVQARLDRRNLAPG